MNNQDAMRDELIKRTGEYFAQNKPVIIKIGLGVSSWDCPMCNSEEKIKVVAMSADEATYGIMMSVFIRCPMCVGIELLVDNKGVSLPDTLGGE